MEEYILENKRRKYFDRDDFYDWGTDHDIMKAYEWLCDEICTLRIMIEKKPYLVNEDKEFNSLFKTINFNMNEKYSKMVYLNFYIVVDECLNRIYKAICMYKNEIINEKSARIDFIDIINKDNEDDLAELFIDNILDQNINNISKKIEEINKICNKFYEFKIDKNFIEELDIFRIERNLLVHSNGVVNKRAIKKLSKAYEGLQVGDKIEYSYEKIERLLEIVSCGFEILYYQVHNFYNPNNQIEPKSYKDLIREIEEKNKQS